MWKYAASLKQNARQLRKNLTESEATLWALLRRKQLLDVQFYRQKPIGQHIVDFFAPRARLVVEVDGSQHLEGEHAQRDNDRDGELTSRGLTVLRFSSRDVLKEQESVVETIYRTVLERLNGEIPLAPLSQKGGKRRDFTKGGKARRAYQKGDTT